MKLQIEAQRVDIRSGGAWEATVTLADGSSRTVGYRLLTDGTPATTATKKAVAKGATVPTKATRSPAKSAGTMLKAAAAVVANQQSQHHPTNAHRPRSVRFGV